MEKVVALQTILALLGGTFACREIFRSIWLDWKRQDVAARLNTDRRHCRYWKTRTVKHCHDVRDKFHNEGVCSEFLATDTEVSGSIPGATRFF